LLLLDSEFVIFKIIKVLDFAIFLHLSYYGIYFKEKKEKYNTTDEEIMLRRTVFIIPEICIWLLSF
jgi:hypothetical protein